MCVGNTTQQEAVIEEGGRGALSRGLSLNRDTTLHGLKFLPPPPPTLVDTVGSRGQGEGGGGADPGCVELGYTV